MMFNLGSPWALLLLSIPYALLQRRRRTGMGVALRFPETSVFRKSRISSRDWGLFWGLCLMVLALARPQWGEWVTTQQARQIVLALDVSGSMRAAAQQADGQVLSRLAVLKKNVRSFLQGLSGDEAGVVIFADKAYTLSPLTSDIPLLVRLVESVQSGMVGEKTAIDAAIALAVSRLQEMQPLQVDNKAVIVFTDGLQTQGRGSLQQAFDAATAAGIRVYPVVIGLQGQPQTEKNMNGRQFMRDLAAQTGGKSFFAGRADALQDALEAIEGLEKKSVTINGYIFWQELYSIPLFFGLLLLLLRGVMQRPV